MTAFARAPPAEVPTRRMSFNAFFLRSLAKLAFRFLRWLRISDASLTKASISIFFAGCGFGPNAGTNSNAPMPRAPV